MSCRFRCGGVVVVVDEKARWARLRGSLLVTSGWLSVLALVLSVSALVTSLPGSRGWLEGRGVDPDVVAVVMVVSLMPVVLGLFVRALVLWRHSRVSFARRERGIDRGGE